MSKNVMKSKKNFQIDKSKTTVNDICSLRFYLIFDLSVFQYVYGIFSLRQPNCLVAHFPSFLPTRP